MTRVLEKGLVELFGTIQAVFADVVAQKLDRAFHQGHRAGLASFSQQAQLRGWIESHSASTA